MKGRRREESGDEAVRLAAVIVMGQGPALATTLAAVDRLSAPPGIELEVHAAADPSPAGAARARNCAIAASRGIYVALLDAGVVPEPHWLEESVSALRDDPGLGIVCPGGSAGADAGGWLMDPPAGAMVFRRSMFDAAEGFHESISGPGLGLDLGWRCWLLGWRARSVDGVDAQSLGEGANLEPVSIADLEVVAGAHLAEPGPLPTGPGWRPRRLRTGATRAGLQRYRRRPDGELGPLLAQAIERGGAALHLRTVLETAGAADRLLGSRRRIVVATADTLATTMAGPGIRALRIAEALSRSHDVHLVTTGRCDLVGRACPVEAVDHDRFAELVRWADVLIFQGWILVGRPWISQSDVVLVADIYDPMHLEQLEQGRDADPEGGRWMAVADSNGTLNEQLRRADLMLCASDKQRDFWLGQLAAVGRVNPILYDEDESFRNRLRRVPFGIDDSEPEQRRHAIRGETEGISDDDEVILWGGGIYNWFDPVTLIRALDKVRHERPNVRLYFLGTKHPNPEIPEMRMAVEARRLAAELDLTGKHVFFNDGWVPFEERADYLLDADLAVSIHLEHIETEFSFRTRILDYLWAGLPVVATTGDSFATLIEEHECGLVVVPGDIDGLAGALVDLLSDQELATRCRAGATSLVDDLRWSETLKPLIDFCQAPTRAPDVACPDVSHLFGVKGPPSRFDEDLALGRRYLSEGGLSMVISKLRSRFERLKQE